MISLRLFIRSIIWGIIAGALAYIAVMLFVPKQFASSTALYFPAAQSKSTGGFAALAGLGGDGEPDGATVSNLRGALVSPLVASAPQTAIGILTSRTALGEAVDKHKLAEHWKINRDIAINRLFASVNARVEKSGFLKVDVQIDDPTIARDVLVTLQNHLAKRATELSFNLSSKNRKFIETQIADAQRRVSEARSDYSSSLSDGLTGSIDQMSRFYFDTRGKLEEAKVSRAAIEQQIRSQKSLLSKLYSMDGNDGVKPRVLESATPNGADKASSTSGTLAALALALQEKRLALKEAAGKFTEDAPEFQAARDRLKEVESYAQSQMNKLKKEVDGGVAPQLLAAESQLKALDATVGEYQKILDRYEARLLKAPADAASTEIARAEFTGALQNLAMLKQEREYALIAEQRDPARYEIVDKAEINNDPVAPRKGLIAIGFFMLGALVGAVSGLTKSPNTEQAIAETD